MKEFLLALQFLTIVPLKIKSADKKAIADSVIYFPVAGLLIGMILYAINSLLDVLGFRDLSSSIILVISLAVITGAIHLDGVSDTFDAISSGKHKDEMLKIMRDPHIGAMGVISILSVITLKTAFLYSINPSRRIASLVLACILSRWALVLAVFLFPYARTEGKARVFFEGKSLKIFLLATLTALILTGLTQGIPGVLILFFVAVFTVIIGAWIRRILGGLTGDTLGAICELNELTALFLSTFILKSSIS